MAVTSVVVGCKSCGARRSLGTGSSYAVGLSEVAGITGTVVPEHWMPYLTLPGVVLALCKAHHLRELHARIEKWGDGQDAAAAAPRLPRHADYLARERGAPRKPSRIDASDEVRAPSPPRAPGSGQHFAFKLINDVVVCFSHLFIHALAQSG